MVEEKGSKNRVQVLKKISSADKPQRKRGQLK
jgi:hypothetical protein